jgi:predicted anti-sigma-YlaC factor YlaD
MKCTYAQSLIIRRLDYELRPIDKHRLDLHLTSCSECQLFMDAQSKLDKMLQDFPAPEFPGDLHQQIMDKVSAPKFIHKHVVVNFWRQIPAAAAIISSLFLGSLLGIKIVATQADDSTQVSQANTETRSFTSSIELYSFGENSILDDISAEKSGVTYE